MKQEEKPGPLRAMCSPRIALHGRGDLTAGKRYAGQPGSLVVQA